MYPGAAKNRFFLMAAITLCAVVWNAASTLAAYEQENRQLRLPQGFMFLEDTADIGQSSSDDVELPQAEGFVSEYIPGQLVVKLKEGCTLEDIEVLNTLYGVYSVQNLFENAPVIRDFQWLSGQPGQTGPSHERWYWQFGNGSREYEEYLQRIKRDKAKPRLQITEEPLAMQRDNSQGEDVCRLDAIYLLEASASVDILSMVAAYQDSPFIEYAQPNYLAEIQASLHTLTNDTYVNPQQDGVWSSGAWGQGYADSWPLDKISAPEAWVTSQGEGVVVAVIDTGVDYNHEDLQAAMWTNPREIPGNGIDDDQNGWVDDVHGYNFAEGNSDPRDDHGHGTHCAGIIAAAADNHKGIAGVAPGARIMSVKGFDREGYGSDAVLAQCIRYAADSGAHILNNAWAGRGMSYVIGDVLQYAHRKGCIIVAAAGNANADARDFYPANIHEAISVAALDEDDQKAVFSNYGSQVDVAAPGAGKGTEVYNILSTVPLAHRFPAQYSVAPGYYRLAGTSMACSYVSGLAALILSHNRGLSNEEVRGILRASADDVLDPLGDGTCDAGWDMYSGYGRINAVQALHGSAGCVAFIATPRNNSIITSGVVAIEGQAYGDSFVSYTLEYAKGTYSPQMSWHSITTSTMPVVSGTLGAWDMSQLEEDGEYTLRLRVEDAYGKTYVFYSTVTVRNAYIKSPVGLEAFKGREKIVICGIASGTSMQYYTLEYGQGTQPQAWSVLGISLENEGRREVADGILGEWDTSKIAPLAQGSLYSLRLCVHYLGGPVKTHQITIGVDFALQDVWSPDAREAKEYNLFPSSSPALADLDGDGDQEVLMAGALAAQETASLESQPVLWAYHYNGIPLGGNWPFSPPDAKGYFTTPAVADVDRDAKTEIVCKEYTPLYERYWVLEPDGSVAEGWPVEVARIPSAGGEGNVCVNDLDNDGDLEIIGPYGNDGMAALHHDGTMVKGWPVTLATHRVGSPAVGDINGDGLPEIIAYAKPVSPDGDSKSGYLYAWNREGSLVAGWPVSLAGRPGSDWSVPVIADLDHNGTKEVIAVESDGREQSVYVWQGNGTLYPGWPQQCRGAWNASLGLTQARAPVVADVDGDGDREIVVAHYHYLNMWHHTGGQAKGWPVVLDTASAVQWAFPNLSAVVGDIDGDGTEEVVMAAFKNTSPNSRTDGMLFAFKSDGTPVESFPKLAKGQYHATVPAIDDVDNDGRTEILLQTQNNPPWVYVWDCNAPFKKAHVAWPTWQHDFQRSGYQSTLSSAAANHPPVAFSQAIVTNEDAPVSFTLRAMDPDKDKLRYDIMGLPFYGTLSGHPPYLTYTPMANYQGSDLLVFKVNDGKADSDMVAVSITINPVNDLPETEDQSVVLDEDTPAEITLHAWDPDGDPLRYAVIVAPVHGVLSGVAPNLVYTPHGHYYGTDSFMFRVDDGSAEFTTATVSITVNAVDAPPRLGLISNKDINENETLSFIVSASDDARDSLTYTADHLPQGAHFDAATRTFTWTPDYTQAGILDAEGVKEVTFRVSDKNGLSASETIVITVHNVNRPPVLEIDDKKVSIGEDLEFTVHAADADEDALMYCASWLPEGASFDEKTGRFSWLPVEGQQGVYTLTFSASDGSGVVSRTMHIVVGRR